MYIIVELSSGCGRDAGKEMRKEFKIIEKHKSEPG